MIWVLKNPTHVFSPAPHRPAEDWPPLWASGCRVWNSLLISPFSESNTQETRESVIRESFKLDYNLQQGPIHLFSGVCVCVRCKYERKTTVLWPCVCVCMCACMWVCVCMCACVWVCVCVLMMSSFLYTSLFSLARCRIRSSIVPLHMRR